MQLGFSTINGIWYAALGTLVQLVLLATPGGTRLGALGHRWWFVHAVTVTIQVGIGSALLALQWRSAP